MRQALWGFECCGRAGRFGSSGCNELLGGEAAEECLAGGVELHNLRDDLGRLADIWALLRRGWSSGSKHDEQICRTVTRS